jgi:hypothetical protein
MSDPIDQQRLLNILNQVHMELQQHGDTRATVLVDGSDEEEETDQASKEPHNICSGYSSVNDGPVLCPNLTSSLLWIADYRDSLPLYFCKASHLLRYLVHHFGKKGAIPAEKKNARKGKKRAREIKQKQNSE